MKIRNGDLKGLLEGFDKIKHLTGHKFVIPFLRNKQLIKDEIDLLEKVKTYSEEFTKLRDSIQSKQISYADKNEDGSPKIESMTFPNGETGSKIVMSSISEKKLAKELLKIEKDNKELIDMQNKKEIDYMNSLIEDCKIKFHIIKLNDLPKDITVEQAELIDFMVDLNK